MKRPRCDMATAVGFSIEFDVDEAELLGYLDEVVAQSDRFRPAWVVDESEHSLYIEFGTNGAHYSKGSGRQGPSPVELELRKWVEGKFHKHGKERDKIAERVYHKIMREGIPPQPFFRPAVNNVLQRISSDPEWFQKEDNSILKVAELIAEEMKRILIENGTPFTNDIVDKIDYFPDDGSRSEDMSSGLSNLPRYVLDSQTADLNGDEQRASEAKKRRIR